MTEPDVELDEYRRDDARPRPKKNWNPWLIVALVGCGCVLPIGACVAFGVASAFTVQRSLDGLSTDHRPFLRSFLQSMETGEYDRAHLMLTFEAQQRTPVQELEERHRAFAEVRGRLNELGRSSTFDFNANFGSTMVHLEFGDADFTSGGARLRFELVGGSDAGWKIESFELDVVGEVLDLRCPHCDVVIMDASDVLCPNCGESFTAPEDTPESHRERDIIEVLVEEATEDVDAGDDR